MSAASGLDAEEARIRAARQQDTSALVDLWATVFTPPLQPDQWLIDDQREAHTLVAVDEHGVCGSIYGLPKRLRESDGAVAAVHCIGSVAVAPRARGRGLARRLVAASLAAAAAADWALLFTGTPDVYRSSGFETFGMQRSLTGPWAAGDAAGGLPEVVRASMRRGCLAEVRRVYERSRSGTVLTPVRDDGDWAMAEVRFAGARLYLCRTGGEVLGYAVARTIPTPGGPTGVIDEVAVDPGSPGSVWTALFDAITADWAWAGVAECDIAAPVADDASPQTLALSAFAPDAVRVRDDTGMTRRLRRTPRIDGIRHFTAGDYF
ncbi:GNAT family N-acetyltransferase [Microbacterium sp.]|uniref:GNAT family N-acetyltransferase n=1 Tax=Microbacterium sp. TaxID=51671 RepID=UPI002810C45A|nr:GNAT family N-acetyltransferase [Microbacterium sp.]